MRAQLHDSPKLLLTFRECARIAGHLATFCDRAEHVEVSDRSVLSDSGQRLRNLSVSLAELGGIPLLEYYAERLRGIETDHPLRTAASPIFHEAARAARTWRQLQEIQAGHDRWYHPDVFGLSKSDQVRHYTLHVTKLTGHLSQLLDPSEADWGEFARRRVPDFLVFGLKMSTLAGETLPDEADYLLEQARSELQPV